jgi:hypothetical protein
MSEIVEFPEDFSGLEKMNYTRFATAYTVRRPSQAPTKFDRWDDFQFPNGSVVHTLNGFDTLEAPNNGLPDPLLPPMVNEKLPVFLMVVTKLPHEDTQPFGVSENYVYRPNLVASHVGHFFKEHRKFHRVLSDRTLRTMAGVLTWLDYSPLNEMRVNGTLHVYRKFDILFRTILDSIVNIGAGKHHYIVLPQGDHVFQRALVQRTFKDLSTNTLNAFLHDPSVFPLLHILGYVYGKTRELSVTPYKQDVKILGKDAEVLSHLRSTSLLERISPDLFSSINFVFQKDNRAVVYNLGDLDKFADDGSFYLKLFRHFMNLRLTVGRLPDHVDPDSEQFDELVESESGQGPVEDTNDAIVRSDTPGIKLSDLEAAAKRAPITMVKTSKVEHSFKPQDPSTTSFEERLRTAAIASTQAVIVAEPKKESRRNQLIEAHLKATLNGKTLGELVQPLETQVIAPKSMGFVTSAPEASYQKSSLLAMDRTYHAHAYHHEMAKVVGSLAKHGMFITKIDEEKTHTEMDRTTTYRVNLADVNGKTHHVKFTVPDVDANGMMKLSGVEYRLTRQIANVPICKISPTRVNLSSYYNKIIVERIQSKRYSFEADTAKLINSLKAKGLLRATSGAAPYPTRKVAYDYTAIGRSFTEIACGGFELHFGGDSAPLDTVDVSSLDVLKPLEDKFGAYVGSGPGDTRLFWNLNNQIVQVDGTEIIHTWASFHTMLVDVLGSEASADRTPLEWTQANIINQTIPLVYILAFRIGLKTLFEMINLEYRFYTEKNDVAVGRWYFGV